MPIALEGANINSLKIAMWGEMIFSAGLLLALPALTALLITNMALGILTRTAPQLNLFGIGFPITLTVGFVVLALSLPNMLQPIEHLIEQGVANMGLVTLPTEGLPVNPS
jgi:flagellar biosynthetic protein FliR